MKIKLDVVISTLIYTTIFLLNWLLSLIINWFLTRIDPSYNGVHILYIILFTFFIYSYVYEKHLQYKLKVIKNNGKYFDEKELLMPLALLISLIIWIIIVIVHS